MRLGKLESDVYSVAGSKYEDMSVQERIAAAKLGDWKVMIKLAGKVDDIPSQSLPLFIDALLIHILQPVPNEHCTLNTCPIPRHARRACSENQSIAIVSKNACWVILCASIANVGGLANTYSTAAGEGERRIGDYMTEKIREAWPHARHWMRHLDKYFYNIHFDGLAPNFLLQIVVSGMTTFIASLLTIQSMFEIVMHDPLVLDIMCSFWMRHNLKKASNLGIPCWAPAAPIQNFASMFSHFSECDMHPFPDVLKGKEKKIVKTALRRLRLVSMVDSQAECVKGPGRELYIGLVNFFTKFSPFAVHLAHPWVAETLVRTMRCNWTTLSQSHSLARVSAQWLIVMLTLESCFNSLRGDACVKTAILTDALKLCESLTSLLDVAPSDLEGITAHVSVAETIRVFLLHCARFTTIRSMLAYVVPIVRRITRETPNVMSNKYTGSRWSILKQVSLERAVCKWIFDQAKLRQRISCNSCSALFQRKALKMCARCKTSLYCSNNCQRIAWSRGGHRNECQGVSETGVEYPDSNRATARKNTDFLQFLAIIDVRRHREFIYDQLKLLGTDLTLRDVTICVNYNQSQMRPLISVHLLDEKDEDLAEFVRGWYDSLGQDGEQEEPRYVRADEYWAIVEVIAPASQANDSGSYFFPIDMLNVLNWQDPDAMRLICSGRVKFQNVDGEDVSSTWDAVDAIMAEYGLEAAAYPHCEFWDLINIAALRAEAFFGNYGVDIYCDWMCQLY